MAAIAGMFISLFIGFFTILFKSIYYVFRNAFLANFLLISGFGIYYLINTYHIDWLYSILISLGVAIIAIIIMAKIKYIRLVLLCAFGAFWGYMFYMFFCEIINIPDHPKFSFGCTVSIGVLYCIGHIKQGLDQGEMFGEVYDPIGWIIGHIILLCGKIRYRILERKYIRELNNNDITEKEFYRKMGKILGMSMDEIEKQISEDLDNTSPHTEKSCSN